MSIISYSRQHATNNLSSCNCQSRSIKNEPPLLCFKATFDSNFENLSFADVGHYYTNIGLKWNYLLKIVYEQKSSKLLHEASYCHEKQSVKSSDSSVLDMLLVSWLRGLPDKKIMFLFALSTPSEVSAYLWFFITKIKKCFLSSTDYVGGLSVHKTNAI